MGEGSQELAEVFLTLECHNYESLLSSNEHKININESFAGGIE